MRDKDGTFVIEISPAMRVIILGGGLALLLVFLFWKFMLPDDESARRTARVELNLPETEPSGAADARSLRDLEAAFGVAEELPFTIEQLSQADSEQLKSIFDELMNRRFLAAEGEESLIFDSLIETSARLAPKRSLRFYSAIEDYSEREFSVTRLFHYWLQRDPEAAFETLPALNESMRFRVIAEELPKLAEKTPEQALAWGLRARDEAFTRFRPDVVRPVFRVWAKNDPSAARAAVATLAEQERPKAMQGLALAQIDGGDFQKAHAWSVELPDDEPAQFAKLTVLEFGIQEHPDLVAEDIERFPNPTLRRHLARMLEAKKTIAAEPPENRQRKAYRLLYSLNAYDVEGRQCIVNAMPDEKIREQESLYLRYRFFDFGDKSYFAFNRCFLQSDDVEVKSGPFRDLLSLSRQALAEGNLQQAREYFLPYLYNVPENEELHELMIEWSKKDGSWLGENLEVLDRVRVPAASFSEAKVETFLKVIADAVADQAGVTFRHYFFQALDGAPTDTYVWGEYGEGTARQALDAVLSPISLIYSEHEFGLLGYYFRDEDTDPFLRWPDLVAPAFAY